MSKLSASRRYIARNCAKANGFNGLKDMGSYCGYTMESLSRLCSANPDKFIMLVMKAKRNKGDL